MTTPQRDSCTHILRSVWQANASIKHHALPRTARYTFAATMTGKRHHFAPLSAGSAINSDPNLLRLQGIVFDMDGTLCEPQNWMFGQMRSAIGIPKSEDILDHINALPEPRQTEAFDKIKAIESEAMSKQIPQAGLVALMEFLDRHGIKKAICTRNFDAPVNHLLEKHIPSHLNPFDPVITRDFKPPKPSPEGILHIARGWRVENSRGNPMERTAEVPLLPIIMVGDSVDDMAAGRGAGALTVLLKSEGKEELETDARTDVAIGTLDELIGLLEQGIRPTR
ncbi:putative hydrolase [Cercospora zeina]